VADPVDLTSSERQEKFVDAMNKSTFANQVAGLGLSPDGVADSQPTYRELIEIVNAREAERVLPKPKRYSPPPCSACTALRQPGTNYTHVKGNPIVRGGYVIRYLKCGFCPNTWKDVQKVQTSIDSHQD